MSEATESCAWTESVTCHHCGAVWEQPSAQHAHVADLEAIEKTLVERPWDVMIQVREMLTKAKGNKN